LTPGRSLAAVAVVVALSSCGSSHKGPSPGPAAITAAVPSTTTTRAAPTTTTTTTSTTAPPAGGPYATFATPDAAATFLIGAWKKGDRGLAAQAATPAAVNALFAQPYPPGGPEHRGCNAGLGGLASCFYRVGQSGLSMQLSDVDGTHWRVVDVQFLT
jgi:hypothetical protein